MPRCDRLARKHLPSYAWTYLFSGPIHPPASGFISRLLFAQIPQRLSRLLKSFFVERRIFRAGLETLLIGDDPLEVGDLLIYSRFLSAIRAHSSTFLIFLKKE
jgi:hypothetical protein